MQTKQTPPFKQKKLLIVVSILVLSVMGYFANKMVQSYLGQQALEDTGLPILSLEQALDKAKSSNKWVLADMSAIWCPTCRKLDQQVFAEQSVQGQLKQNFVYARIEYDSPEGEAFMKKYKVVGFPTLLILNQEGQKLEQLPLAFEPSRFIQILQQVVTKHK